MEKPDSVDEQKLDAVDEQAERRDTADELQQPGDGVEPQIPESKKKEKKRKTLENRGEKQEKKRRKLEERRKKLAEKRKKSAEKWEKSQRFKMKMGVGSPLASQLSQRVGSPLVRSPGVNFLLGSPMMAKSMMPVRWILDLAIWVCLWHMQEVFSSSFFEGCKRFLLLRGRTAETSELQL